MGKFGELPELRQSLDHPCDPVAMLKHWTRVGGEMGQILRDFFRHDEKASSLQDPLGRFTIQLSTFHGFQAFHFPVQ
jgi:hypothetical protein